MHLKLKPYKGKFRWYFKTKRTRGFRRLTRLDPVKHAHIYEYCAAEYKHRVEIYDSVEEALFIGTYECEVTGLYLNPKKPVPQSLDSFLENCEHHYDAYMEIKATGERVEDFDLSAGRDFSYQDTNSNPAMRITLD